MDNQSATPESITTETAQPTAAATPATPTPSMPHLPVLPSSSSPFGSGSGTGSSPLMFILIGILGLGALVFGVMTVVFFNKAQVATTTLNTQKAAAVAKAQSDQKKADEDANTIANESPFRSYVAPVDFGSFEIKFPKNWSGYVDQEKNGTQVSLVVNPDFVRRTNGDDELAATRVLLIERPQDQYMTAFSSLIKRGTIKQSNITVSGQQAFDLTGQFLDNPKATREVIVPVRDKVMVFVNENSKYADEFNQILAQARIIP